MKTFKTVTGIILGIWVVMIILSIFANLLGYALKLSLVVVPVVLAGMYIYRAIQKKRNK